MARPSSSEYIPAAAHYASLVPDGDLLSMLSDNKRHVAHFFLQIPSNLHDYRYDTGKWTPKEMLLHITDTERVFAYRALTIARGDAAAVFPNMDQALFAAHVNPSNRTIQDLCEEFEVVRDSSIFLYKHLTPEALQRKGTLFGHSVTARGFGYLIIGHPLHHLNILHERYLH